MIIPFPTRQGPDRRIAAHIRCMRAAEATARILAQCGDELGSAFYVAQAARHRACLPRPAVVISLWGR
jgi:hypothetical protein